MNQSALSHCSYQWIFIAPASLLTKSCNKVL